MKTDFTPGPWKAIFKTVNDSLPNKLNYFYTVDENDLTLNGSRPLLELVANAYLMNAAPEMLSVLIATSDELSRLHESLDTLGNSDSRKIRILDIKREIDEVIELATKI